MRFALGFFAVLLAPSLLCAQTHTIAGCVTAAPPGVVLWTIEASRQTFDSSNLVDEGERFLLVGDDDLLEEIALRDGHEIQVTGRINPDAPPPAIVEPLFPPPGGGNFPPGVGLPGDPGVTTRVTGPGRRIGPFRAVRTDVILVEEYRTVRAGCRRIEGF